MKHYLPNSIFISKGMRMMFIRLAETKDTDDWRIVAENVASIFGHPTMAKDPAFIEYMQNKIEQRGAITAVDAQTGTCIGLIGISYHFNRISWFGVLESHRNKGVGSQLLQSALDRLDTSKEITVDTYRNDYLPGLPARHVYMKHGFTEIDNTLFDNLGNERCRLSVSPSGAK